MTDRDRDSTRIAPFNDDDLAIRDAVEATGIDCVILVARSCLHDGEPVFSACVWDFGPVHDDVWETISSSDAVKEAIRRHAEVRERELGTPS